MNSANHNGSLESTRILDVAKGIIIGLRGCSQSEAFNELVAVAAANEMGPLTISRALVSLAEGVRQTHAPLATECADRAWASLLQRRPLVTENRHSEVSR